MSILGDGGKHFPLIMKNGVIYNGYKRGDMRRTAPMLPLALALLLAHPAFALDARAGSWAELAPTPVQYENPFDALTAEQMDGLRRLVRLQSGGVRRAAASTDVSALQAELRSSGLDVEGLLNKRLEIMETAAYRGDQGQ